MVGARPTFISLRHHHTHGQSEALVHTLHIEHPITDLATWRAAFDRFTDIRAQSGVLGHRVRQPVDDPNYVVIDLDFATAHEAKLFLDFLEDKVWVSPESSPALVGAPRTMILKPAQNG
jgi:hypothetical protein